MTTRKTARKESAMAGAVVRSPQERGIYLGVSGTALIRQTDERIAWQRRSVTMPTAELDALSNESAAIPVGSLDARDHAEGIVSCNAGRRIEPAILHRRRAPCHCHGAMEGW